MRRLLPLLFSLAACAPRPVAVPTAEAPLLDPAAPRSPRADAPPPRLVPFVEPVELDRALFERHSLREFLPEYALLEPRRGARDFVLMRLATLEAVPLPELAAQTYPGKVRLHAVDARSVVIAEVQGDDALTVLLLRPERLQWEEVGRFDLPKPPEGAADRKSQMTPVALHFDAERAYLKLSDTVEVVARHELDLESLVWAPGVERAVDGPCLMGSCKMEQDLVQWGIRAPTAPQPQGEEPAQAASCVAVRSSEEEPWRPLSDPPAEVLLARRCQMLDGQRALVTGGIRFAFPPFSRRADVVDIAKGEVRPLGEVSLGTQMRVPGELVWIKPGQLARFDAATEQFAYEEAPAVGFEPQYTVRIDDLTVLVGRVDKETAQFAKLGLRWETPTAETP